MQSVPFIVYLDSAALSLITSASAFSHCDSDHTGDTIKGMPSPVFKICVIVVVAALCSSSVDIPTCSS